MGLDVYYRTELVGHLHSRGHDLEFEYASAWLKSDTSFSISISLPLGRGVRSGGFFANLLPEGAFRELLTRRLRIAYDDDFALLEALGGECAGALTLLTAGSTPDQPTAHAAEMPLAELESVALSGSYADATLGARRARLSLAGAQSKLPVIVDDERFYLPLGNTPSTHLLKFENSTFRHLPENEVLTTAILRELGLPCATTKLLRVGTGKQARGVCCVTRYDRLRAPNRTVRLHQEDFCQALGLPSHAKYEADGGPSFARILGTVRQHSREPFVDARVLIDWWLSCWLVGNSDAHAKNLAFLYHEQPGSAPTTPRLSPFYDLVCTRAYEKLDRRLATAIGGEADPGQIGRTKLRTAAADIGVRASFIIERVRELASQLPAVVDSVVLAQRQEHGARGIYEFVERAAKTQSRRALTLLEADE